MKRETLTLEIDSGLKNELERVCRKLGMSISAAFAVLARRFIRENTAASPAEEDLFYSPSNIAYLEKVTAEIDSGEAKLSEHELIEA